MSKMYNQEFIEKLNELAQLMKQLGENFRARAYEKASDSIIKFDKPIHSVDDIKHLPNVGKTIIKKLSEYVETGKISKLEKEKNNPVKIFTDIYGVGPKKAAELVSKHNIKTIKELKANEDLLNDKQKLGLKYYDDILKRIPRDEIIEYNKKLTKIFNDVSKTHGINTSSFEIVGSFRRGAKTSGDIDIIVTDKNNDKTVFNKFIDILVEKKLLVELLSRGDTKSLTIAKLSEKSIARRVDFMYSPYKEYGFAILYFTGSKMFNTVMRHEALKMGYTMNEHGFHKMNNGRKGAKVEGSFPSEKSIFDFLNIKYVEPTERINGNNIVKTDIKIKIKVKKKTKKKINIKSIISSFKKGGIDYIKILSKDEVGYLLRYASDKYYNSQPVMTDNQYDIIREFVETKYPDHPILNEIGAPIQHNKVLLPIQAPSLNKIKPSTNELPKWTKKYKGPYVLSAKLDGATGIYDTRNGTQKLYTRGNGTYGQDISSLLKYMNLPKVDNCILRGELIMKKSTFQEKYADKFSNARNLVSGIINSKTLDIQKIKDVDFVVYEVIEPQLIPSKQLEFIKKHKLLCVKNQQSETLTNNDLSLLLVDWRKNYTYEIDGIVVKDNKNYQRTDKNPKHAIAFKMILSDQLAEAKVLDILWAPSKDGYLKPRARIEPLQLNGVKIEYVTAFNAKYVRDNKLGVGSLIKLVRSGDVIPHILEITMSSDEPKMPDEEYVWNDTGVDIMLKNKEDNDIVQLKNIVGFFKGIGVESLGEGNVKKMMNSGLNSIAKILAASKDDLLKVENFKEKMANKVYTNIKTSIEKTSLPVLMHATNIFGRGLGVKKITPILEKYPDILISKDTEIEKVEKISKLRGMAKKTATAFVKHIKSFNAFVEESKLQHKVAEYKPKMKSKTGKLSGKRIIITGFRDKELQEKIVKEGGEIGSSVSKNVDVVIVKSLNEDTAKVEKARELKLNIMLKDDFIKKYLD